MKFTSTPPTTPGFYAWKSGHDTDNKHCVAEALTASSLEVAHKNGGVWCLLVPAEEVEKAFNESALKHDRLVVNIWAWNKSRAKRVAEGTELV